MLYWNAVSYTMADTRSRSRTSRTSPSPASRVPTRQHVHSRTALTPTCASRTAPLHSVRRQQHALLACALAHRRHLRQPRHDLSRPQHALLACALTHRNASVDLNMTSVDYNMLLCSLARTQHRQRLHAQPLPALHPMFYYGR